MNARCLVMLFGAAVATAASAATALGHTETVHEDWCLRIDDQVVNDAGVKGTVVSSHCDPQDEEYRVQYEDGSKASYLWSELTDQHDPMPRLIGRSHKTYDAMHGLSE